MKRVPTLFLRVVLVLMAVFVLALFIILPKTEGAAVGKDLLTIYSDPVWLYVYAASTPFFIALFQAFKLLGYIDSNKAFSELSVRALRNITYCAVSIIGLIVLAEFFLIFFIGEEDKAGPVALGIYTIFITTVIATFAAVLQKLIQNAVDLKSENDLTV
jgi:hypothetical protein